MKLIDRATGWSIILWVIATACAIFLRPITPIDETRYVTVAWEMHLSRDWWLPTLNGLPYPDKPPLLFWLINLGWSIFGVNDWWPRLLPALFGLAALLLVARCARLLLPSMTLAAPLAQLVLAALPIWVLFTGAVMFDVPMAFFVLAAVIGILSISDGTDAFGWASVGALLGLAMLTKGPVVMLYVLPLALSAPWWRVSSGARAGMIGAWRRWYGGVCLALLVAVIVGGAWVAVAARSAGLEFLRALFWDQTVHRIATTTHHLRPFWFYFWVLPVLLLPWTLTPMVWRSTRTIAAGAVYPRRVLACWILPAVVALSSFRGKQVHYLLPLLPAIAIAIGWMLASALEPAPERVRRSTDFIGLSATMLLVMVYGAIVSSIGKRYDVRPIAEKLAALQASGRAVANLDRYHGQYQFAGKLRMPIEEITEDSEWQQFKAAHPDGVVIAYGNSPPGAELKWQEIVIQRYRSRVAILLPVSAVSGQSLETIRESLNSVREATELSSSPR